MSGTLFKAGEFASLCRVKKDTLLHYDHIGILKPEFVAENGYRYYSVKQLYTFDLISALKRLGMSLQDIKLYIDKRNPSAFLSLLHQQLDVLEEEKKRLENVQFLLEKTIASTKLAQSITAGDIRLEECPEEYYIAVKAPKLSHYDEPQYLLKTRPLLEWAKENGGFFLPPGDIVTEESLKKQLYVEDFYYCRIAEPDGPNTLVKPAGTYAVLYHRGNYESLEQAYRTLSDWILDQGYSIAGHLYEEDLLHYMSTTDPDEYMMKISIQVIRSE